MEKKTSLDHIPLSSRIVFCGKLGTTTSYNSLLAKLDVVKTIILTSNSTTDDQQMTNSGQQLPKLVVSQHTINSVSIVRSKMFLKFSNLFSVHQPPAQLPCV